MHKDWNPKFGFFLPCTAKTNNVHDITQSDFGRMQGPFPLEEFCDIDSPISERMDCFLTFIKINGNKINNINRGLVVLCDYRQVYHSRNFLVCKNTVKINNRNYHVIPSSLHGVKYVRLPASALYFTAKRTRKYGKKKK